jgi:hypothetical protein
MQSVRFGFPQNLFIVILKSSHLLPLLDEVLFLFYDHFYNCYFFIQTQNSYIKKEQKEYHVTFLHQNPLKKRERCVLDLKT